MFIDFFVQRGHVAVPSMSLVPGGDTTLLFTNSGMVQFKNVFLGTEKYPYTRVVDSQKCMRIEGKHNDLEDVGFDDSHHTFFEMLGNWSFGDYYKKEAIAWSWELLTEVWGLPKERLYATCFEDELGEIPRDDEAVEAWCAQPGFLPDHVYFFGRKENFWQMADTGPCGPCSEIHIDLGEERDNLRGKPHRCGVNGECNRFLELWNNVFIQYNRLETGRLEPLPAKHVDTGMGLERIVSVLQGVDSNYKTDLFAGSLVVLRSLTGHSEEEMYANFTPYRVIADHVRAASFLIADGVVPGNSGRNYVTRMLIRRAVRFGTKLSLHEPFLAKVAEAVIEQYGDYYTELRKGRLAILDYLTREEVRFARTLEAGSAQLENLLNDLRASGQMILDGHRAYDLYATYGLPFEITRDIAREHGLEVDEQGFQQAKEEHSLASGGGKAMGKLGGEDAQFYADLLRFLQEKGKLDKDGVEYDPYSGLQVEKFSDLEVLALVVNGEAVESAEMDDQVEVLLPRTGFYVEAGGQVSDTGYICGISSGDRRAVWEIEVTGMRKPVAGVIVHVGVVISGQPKVGDLCVAEIDIPRRRDIMRNHTATHLLHKALHEVLGSQAMQAGSLVAPDRLRFDFNHPVALTPEQLERLERIVNDAIAADMPVHKEIKTLTQAREEGAIALFGEKYTEIVRTLTIGDPRQRYSYELCGGTHVDRTSDIGMFLIVSESSVGTNVRRIEAVTGRGAYQLATRHFQALKQAAASLKTTSEEVPAKVEVLKKELEALQDKLAGLRRKYALIAFQQQLSNLQVVGNVKVLAAEIPDADADTLRSLTDRFRQQYSQNGAVVLVSGALVIAAVTDDLVQRGLKAADLIVGIGGKGGGRPTLAQGSLPNGRVQHYLQKVAQVIQEKVH